MGLYLGSQKVCPTVTVEAEPTLITKSITENGTYTASDDNADGYSSVTVDVSQGITRVVENGVYTIPTTSFSFSLPSTATDIAPYTLRDAFSVGYDETLTRVDLSSLITVSGASAFEYAFESCFALTSVNLSSLTTISGEYAFSYAFRNCSALTSVDLSSLTTVSGEYAFEHAFESSALTSVNLSSLTTISGEYAFGRAFALCSALTSLSFPALTSTSLSTNIGQFSEMLDGVNECTVHFPSNLESVIGSWDDVISGFWGDDTTVLFDLEATT